MIAILQGLAVMARRMFGSQAHVFGMPFDAHIGLDVCPSSPLTEFVAGIDT